MRRLLLILLTAMATLAAVAGGYLGWQWLGDQSDVYTDGASIRQRAGGAPVREILWTRALPVEGLNSAQDDYEATVSADGSTIVFVRGRPGAGDRGADLYTARRLPDGRWTEPVPLDAINTGRDELGPSLSPDGSRLYFYSDRPGGRGGYDIWVSQRPDDYYENPPGDPGAWSEPVNLGEAVNSRYNECGVALAPDGRSLYFATNRPAVEPEFAELSGGLFGEDVYNIHVAPITAGGLGEARLVPELSSAGNDSSPAISPAGDFIYFASDRPGGMGGYDIYRSRLFRGAPLPPENLGSAINTPYDDLDPAVDLGGFGIRFTSDRPLEGRTLADGEVLDYNLYHSVSREVIRKRDPHAAIAAIIENFPAFLEQVPSLLVWVLLLLLALLLLFIVGKFTTDEAWQRRWKRLSLLTKCILLSVLAHALLAGGLVVWRVHTMVTDLLGDSPPRVTIVSREVGSDLASQVRSGLTEVSVEATASATLRHEAQLEPVRTSEASLEVIARQLPPEHPTEAALAEDAAPETPQRPVTIETEAAAATPVRPPEAQTPQRTGETAIAIAPGAAPSETAPLTDLATTATELAAAPETVERPAEALRYVPDATDAAPETSAHAPTLAAAPTSNPAPVAVPAAAEAERADEAPLEAGAIAVAPARAAAPTPEATEVGVAEMSPGASADRAPRALDAASPTEVAAITSDHIAITDGAGPADLRGVAEPRAAAAEAANETQLALAPGAASSVRAAGVDPSGEPVAEANLAPVEADAPVAPLAGAPAPRTTPDAEAAASAPAAIAAAPDIRAGADVRLPEITGATPGSEAELAPGAIAAGAPRAPEQTDAAEVSTAALAPSERTDDPEQTLALAPANSASDAAPMGVFLPPPLAELDPGPQLALRAPDTGDEARDAESAPADPAQPRIAAAEPGAVRATPAPDSAPAEAAIHMAEPELSSAGVERALAAIPLPDFATEPTREPGALGAVPLPAAATIDLRLPEITEPVVALYEHREEGARKRLVERGGGSPQTEAAVAAALEWLARHQEASGAWNGRTFDRHRVGGVATYDFETALTGLSLMCFLGAGHTHMQPGPYRDNVQRGIDWLVAAQRPDGDLRGGSTMYNHGIATIALCEAYGMTGDPRLRDPAQRAVRFVERAQDSRRGGWRYEPQQAGDTSVLGWQVMALVSARRAELEVSDGVFEAASAWLDTASRRSSPGLYAYQPRMAPTVSMTAEGMFTRQLLGEDPQSPRMIESAAYITREMPRWHGDQTTYAWYYATMALYQHGGDTWNLWNDQLSRTLIERQRRDGDAAGSWDPMDRWSRIGGRIYQTAICALTLEVYYRYLPGYLQDGK